MPRICLTAVNSKFSQTNLALLYLKKAIGRNTECILSEWDINRSRRELIEQLVDSCSTHFVFSVYIWNAEYLKALIPELSVLVPDSVICCGGPEAVYNSPSWLQIPGLDFILAGNAEDFGTELPELKKPDKPAVIKKHYRAFSETSFPYTEESIAALKGRILYYEASRGCLHKCSYCLSAADSAEHISPDYRTIEQITEELRLLSRFEGTVKFVDRTFNANHELSRFIWRLMAANPPAGCFHFEIHPRLLQEEDLELLAGLKPGTAQFEIGIQSTDPAVLKNVNRKDDWTHSREMIKKLIELGRFHIHLDQIAGLPGDTPETAARSFNEIISLQPDRYQLGFLKLLPGTPLAAQSRDFGILSSSNPPYEILRTSGFSFSELQKFHRIERLTELLYNSGFFRKTLPFLAQKTGSWFGFFESLLNGAPDFDCRRWDYWGRIIFEFTKKFFPESEAPATDLLRFDWCPFAGAQHYPGFIKYADDKSMNRLKTEACLKVQTEHPELKKSELKRAILFVPESEKSSALLPGGNVLFVKHEGITRKIKI